MINSLRIDKNKKRRVLLIAEEYKAKEIERKLRNGSQQTASLTFYNLDGSYGIFEGSGKLSKKVIHSRNPAEGMATVIQEADANEVFIARPVSYTTIVDTMLQLGRDGVKFMVSPEIYHKECGTSTIKRTDQWILPAVNLNPDVSHFYTIVKRWLDIAISTITLLFSLPLFTLVALLIKITSKGSVFYTQRRCGLNGYPFKIYKFRTMVRDAEKLLTKLVDFDKLTEPVFKLKNDPRVTPVGRILRATSIDELPQLINVLKGDLSLVGPRPEEVGLVKRYNTYYRERLRVKPGITGFQQVICRGTPSLTERMKYDLDYITNRSLWLDLKILFRTVWVVVAQKRAP